MNALRHELPTALRRLARAPGFSLAVVSFLGASIAALLAVAAVVHGLWLRPLAYADEERLVDVRGFSRAMSFSLGLSPPLVAELRETYPAIAEYGPWERRGAQDGLLPTAISSGALAALATAPRIGRLFDPDAAGADEDAVLISDSLWASRFGRDASVLDRTLEYAGRERRIVGVMPAGFRFPDGAANAWLPLVLSAADTAPQNAQMFGGMQVVARLAPEGSTAAFDAALQSRYAADERIAMIREHMQLAFEASPLRAALAGSKSGLVAVLGAAVAVVMLTTLANLANLWLARALARQRELAVASALGASAGRAAASVLAEVMILTTAACLLGLVLAPLALSGLYAAGVVEATSALVVEIDATMAALALGIALVLSLVLAFPTWWLIRRVSGLDALRQGPTVVSDRPSLARARRALIAVQVAVAFALLGTGGLLLRSLDALLAEDAGFARHGTVLAAIHPRVASEHAEAGPPTAAETAAVRALFERVRSHRGVVASFTNAAPFSGAEAVATFLPPGGTPGEDEAAKSRTVGPQYFGALGIALIAGPGFSADAAGEVVVDEVFARRYLRGDPIGQSLGQNAGDGQPYTTERVVGVVRTVKHAALDERDEQGTFYSQAAQPDGSSLQIVVGTSMPLADVRALLEREAAAAGLVVSRIATIDALVWDSLRERTALLGMIGGFALFGTALAALGLYAVLAFATRRRTAEYGLKLALGADRPQLVREVVRDALRIAMPGLVLGGFAAALAVRALGPRLHGVGAGDPLTWLAVAGSIVLIVLLAAAIPARRAASVSPTAALRQD